MVFADDRDGGVPLFFGQTRLGNLGVDFFLVLSGFIILFAHHADIGHPGRLRNDVAKRFFRIDPIDRFVTAGLLVAAVLTNGRSPVPQSLGDLATTVALVRFHDFRVPIGPWPWPRIFTG
ncbi:hypothetical protein GN316_21400 [Xylophilus sp. Kf1]|nr:hypothetical protein [Xylophilus sp. Kf1]